MNNSQWESGCAIVVAAYAFVMMLLGVIVPLIIVYWFITQVLGG